MWDLLFDCFPKSLQFHWLRWSMQAFFNTVCNLRQLLKPCLGTCFRSKGLPHQGRWVVECRQTPKFHHHRSLLCINIKTDFPPPSLFSFSDIHWAHGRTTKRRWPMVQEWLIRIPKHQRKSKSTAAMKKVPSGGSGLFSSSTSAAASQVPLANYQKVRVTCVHWKPGVWLPLAPHIFSLPHSVTFPP